jgi:uncharacterized membrane protein
MILAALCTSFGQLFWKLSEAALNINLIIGFFLYFLGAVLMIAAFRFGKLSILHPLLSIGYVISSILGLVFLKESLSISSILGIAFIMAGVVLIGGESN